MNKSKDKGFQSRQEPIIKTQIGMRKPDLVLAKEGVALVSDTIICSDNAELYEVNRQKVYYNTPELQDCWERETKCERVEFCSIAITWRGAMARETSEVLHRTGITADDRIRFGRQFAQPSTEEKKCIHYNK